MSGLILEKEILVQYGAGGEIGEIISCKTIIGYKIACPYPAGLKPDHDYQINLQLWPQSPLLETDDSIYILNWPILEKVEPNVLISGYPGQTLTIIGKNFISAQPILADKSILWGHEVSYTVLSDTELLIESLPVLPSTPGNL